MEVREGIFVPLRQLSKLIRTRQLSPVSLTRRFLDRLKQLGPQYNSVVTLTEPLAEAQACKAEQEIERGVYRGSLHGIPYGLKDVFATEGIPTTWGAAVFRQQIFNYDATIVERLRAAGAILTAKLALVELAGGVGYRQANAAFTGPGLNPWNKNTWSGGSSSGSGSAVAAGLVPFAIGTETWGSIMGPATNCGISGLRPTFGRVSRYGGMPLTYGMDKPGPMCLTADDCGLVLNAIAGYDENDDATTKRSYSYKPYTPQGRRLRLAVPAGVPEGSQPCVQRNFHEALTVLKEVADVDVVTLPDFPYAQVSSAIFQSESASVMEDIIESGITEDLTSPEGRYGIYPRTTMLATDYLRALRIRHSISVHADRIFSDYDALVSPTRPTPAPLADRPWTKTAEERDADPLGEFGSCIGLPAISIPIGLTKDDLPVGLQIVGRAYEENVILSVANAYQELTDWHTSHPLDLIENL